MNMTAAEYRQTKAAKPSKYRNRKTVVDGITFDSAIEARRYSVLKMLSMAGDISDLRLQPSYNLEAHGAKICAYRADFEYRDCITGEAITEDVKGFETPEFKLKRKLFEAQYGRRIKITGAKR